MATFGGVDLGTEGAGAFALTTTSGQHDFTYCAPDGSTVVIPANSKYLVVRQCPGTGFDEVHRRAREAANKALDMSCGKGGPALVMAQKDSPYVVAWMASVGHTVRCVGRDQLTTRFTATVEVRDADGQVVVQPPPPEQEWRECLRYYRMSESSTDLYDSFRNLYLAIESLLSEIVPPDASEGDSDWLRRALRTVGEEMDLSAFAPSPDEAPHNAIRHDLYKYLRTAIFHAKVGRQTWTPQDWSSRSTVVEARVRYARLYRALADKCLGIAYPAGGIVKAFWEDTFEGILTSHEVFVSNDVTNVDDEPSGEYQPAPAGGEVIRLPTVAADDMAEDWCRGVMGVAAATTVHEALGEIRRFGSFHDQDLAAVQSLSAPLTIDGVAELQVVLLVEGRNFGQPRQDFET